MGATTAVAVLAGLLLTLPASAAARTGPAPTPVELSHRRQLPGHSVLARPDDAEKYLETADAPSDRAGTSTRHITVTPDTDLVDGQSVTVDGTGFDGDPVVGLLVCAIGRGRGGCDLDGLTLLDQHHGAFHIDVTVHAVIQTADGETVDCRSDAQGCHMTANDHFSLNGAAIAPLAFDPNAPLEPPPTITATPDTDLVDGDVVDVSGSGFHPGEEVLVIECRATVESDPDALFDCTGFAFAEADANGEIALQTRVATIVQGFLEGAKARREGGLPPATTTDCRTDDCVLYASADFRRFATAKIAFDPDAPVLPPFEATATPHTGLVDAQQIDVSVEGALPDAPLVLVQCSWTNGDCDPATEVRADADATGAARTSYAVHQVIDAAGTTDCRDPNTCLLVVLDDSEPPPNGIGLSVVDLEFVDDRPPPPAPPPADPTPLEPHFTG